MVSLDRDIVDNEKPYRGDNNMPIAFKGGAGTSAGHTNKQEFAYGGAGGEDPNQAQQQQAARLENSP